MQPNEIKKLLCFDPGRAEFPARVVPIQAVIDLLHIDNDPRHIEAYRRAMVAGERFPPISVLHIAGRYLIADGHKRFQAYRALAQPLIVVEVWSGGRWLRDQWAQFRHKSAQQARLLGGAWRDPLARAQLRRLAYDTIGHWRRVACSLTSLKRARAGAESTRA